MVFTTTGFSGVQVAIGSVSSNRPQYMAIGSGSGTAAVSNVALVYETDRRVPTSISLATTNKIKYIADWNSVEMSGTNLKEFAMFTDSMADTGSCWNREGFGGIDFNGANELQIQLTYEIY